MLEIQSFALKENVCFDLLPTMPIGLILEKEPSLYFLFSIPTADEQTTGYHGKTETSGAVGFLRCTPFEYCLWFPPSSSIFEIPLERDLSS